MEHEKAKERGEADEEEGIPPAGSGESSQQQRLRCLELGQEEEEEQAAEAEAVEKKDEEAEAEKEDGPRDISRTTTLVMTPDSELQRLSTNELFGLQVPKMYQVTGKWEELEAARAMLRAKGFSTVDVTNSEKLLAGMSERMCVATLGQEGVVQQLRAELDRTAGLHTAQSTQDQDMPYPPTGLAPITQRGVQQIAQDQDNSEALGKSSSLNGYLMHADSVDKALHHMSRN